MFQLWFFHHNPPWDVNGDGNVRYPEDKKSYLHMVRLYNEARQREMEEAKAGRDNKKNIPGPRPDGREVISTTAPPGFARPEQEEQQKKPQRGVGHITGPGVRIGRVTKVGKHRKYQQQQQ